MRTNRRADTLFLLIFAGIFLSAIALAGGLLTEPAGAADFTRKNLPPCLAHPFGTDWMGRDMLARTVAGLSLSIRVGGLTALLSGGSALLLGTVSAACGPRVDALVSWVIDLVLGIPHILLIILVSLACGRGFWGVTAGVSRGRVLRTHLLPHLLPQLFTGLILQFPHAILHEAGVTFLGFGLSPERPAIGIILEESMGYLAAGRWWLALFPGLSLVLVVMLFALAGERLRLLLTPASAQE